MIALLAVAGLLGQGRPQIGLSNPSAEAIFDLGGGSFVSFQLRDRQVNPLRWQSPGDSQATNRPMAHFLCLDRWGQPTQAELAAGMPYHGEATRVPWKRTDTDSVSRLSAVMSATLPMAGLQVERRAELAADAPLITVTETVTNQNKLGKVYNMVQHPTIGPPFLDEDTLVDANARQGFMQSSPLPNPEQPSTKWPQALKDGQPVDLRRLRNDPMPNVVSFVVDDPIGWTTASSPKQGVLIGYLWKTAEYPWFNVWRHVDETGKPLARGLEFGTTGLHQPFPVLVQKGPIFGRPIVQYLDAGASAARSWAAFLAPIPKDWQGVDRVTIESGKVTIQERGSARVLTVSAAPVGF